MLKKHIYSLAVLSLLIANGILAQHRAKPVAKPKPKVTAYYVYNRTDKTYDGLSVLISKSTVAAKPAYKLDFIYTSAQAAKQITFIALADTSLQRSVQLVDDGTQPIDSKTLSSYKYHVDLSDADMQFFSKTPIQSISLTDAAGQNLAKLGITTPLFLSQQISGVQNATKSTPVRKKTAKLTPVKRTPTY